VVSPPGERHAAVLSSPAVRSLDRRAGVGEQERAGAVGALRVARLEAGLAEQRGLLVACESGDRELEAAEGLRVRRADLAPVRDQLRQRIAGYAEEAAQLVGPVTLLEVEQQRAAGVGDVGDVPGTARHPCDEVGVDRADGVAALLDECPGVRLVLAQPGQLGAGEVGVQPKAGELADPLLVARLAESLADVSGAAVLPDDRAPRGAECLAVPQHDRLALVGDADRREVGLGSCSLRTWRVASIVACQISSGGVLHPAGLREVLRELLIALRGNGPVGCDHDRRDARGAGIDGQNAHARDHSESGPPRQRARGWCGFRRKSRVGVTGADARSAAT
jgi:hypothetical protein